MCILVCACVFLCVFFSSYFVQQVKQKTPAHALNKSISILSTFSQYEIMERLVYYFALNPYELELRSSY